MSASDKIRDSAIKQGEKVLSLLDEKDKDSIIAWQIALEDKNIDINKKYYTNEQVSVMQTSFGCFSFVFCVILILFLLTRPSGWPNECPQYEACNLPHREVIHWSKACDGEIKDTSFCSKDRITWIADIGRWKCESFNADSVEFKCKANLQAKETY
jgi:hypothetical protein